MDPNHKDRAYHTLDGLRGAAALLVVTRHVGAFFPAGLFPESFLAVDLFFLLSGFVIAHAYEARLRAGRPFAAFMKTRLIRLYPLYILGVAAGVAARVVQARADHAPLDLVNLGQALAVGVAMLPAAPFQPFGGPALDGPTWTLAPELLVNAVYAAALRWLTRPALWGVTVLGALGLAACEWAYGALDGGWEVRTFPLIAARLAFSFFAGVLTFRYRPQRRVRPVLAWACIAATVLVLTFTPTPAWRQAYELGAVLAVFPVVLAVAVRSEPGRLGKPLFAWLGAVSYAVYVLHHPMGNLAAAALDAFDALPHPSIATGAAFLAAVTLAGTLADKGYDGPARRWLNGLRRPPARSASGALSAGEA